jgi:dihydroorotase
MDGFSPVPSCAQALEYKRSILEAVPASSAFEPLMTLYLTDNTPPEEVAAARAAGVVAFKLYPAGATTNSDSGVTDVARCMDTLAAMAEVRGRLMTCLIMHGSLQHCEAAAALQRRQASCCWCTAR